jgi:ribosomal protein S18 acetylase RimI-like enzyme
MNLIKTNHLTDEQLSDIQNLQDACFLHDGLKNRFSFSNSINYYPDMPSYYMLYDHEQLVSFLMLFTPQPTEAEVSAMTLPQQRRMGCFRRLLHEAGAELRIRSFEKVLFVCEHCSKDGRAVIKHFGAAYEFSEYTLCFQSAGFVKYPTALRLSVAQPDDLDELAVLAHSVFGDSRKDFISMLKRSFEAEEITVLSAWLGAERLGLCRVVVEEGKPCICTFGVSPCHRGKGYGMQFLNLVLERLVDKGYKDIIIEVDSQNNAAYPLYLKAGFEVQTQQDYFALELN